MLPLQIPYLRLSSPHYPIFERDLGRCPPLSIKRDRSVLHTVGIQQTLVSPMLAPPPHPSPFYLKENLKLDDLEAERA